MNRTTELIKGCGKTYNQFMTCGSNYLNELCLICKAELKGRLDVLKDEKDNLNNLKLINDQRKGFDNISFVINSKLQEITKEINEIEEKLR